VRRLPIDRIKLDRSFTLDIERERVARDIVATMASLCHSLDLECIVEGVETVTQMQIWRPRGVSGYQGYLFSRPMPEEGGGAAISPDRPVVPGDRRQSEPQMPLRPMKTRAPALAATAVAAASGSQ
jgi:EAL domain-containing protein (putative c-di-GMP-specific phosphodiesterase class I)